VSKLHVGGYLTHPRRRSSKGLLNGSIDKPNAVLKRLRTKDVQNQHYDQSAYDDYEK
jgi:hypothetical protein